MLLNLIDAFTVVVADQGCYSCRSGLPHSLFKSSFTSYRIMIMLLIFNGIISSKEKTCNGYYKEFSTSRVRERDTEKMMSLINLGSHVKVDYRTKEVIKLD